MRLPRPLSAVALSLFVVWVTGCTAPPLAQAPPTPGESATPKEPPVARLPSQPVPTVTSTPKITPLTLSAPVVAQLKERLVIVTPEGGPELPRVSNAQYSPDGEWLVFAVSDERDKSAIAAIRLRDFQVFTQPHAGSREFAFVPGQAAMLVYHAKPTTLGIWRLGGERQELPLPFDGPIPELAFSADGHWLAVVQSVQGTGAIVTLWDLQERRKAQTFSERGERLDRVKLSPDGKLVALFSDTWVHLYDVSSGQRLSQASFERARIVGFSADGKVLYSLESRMLQEWTVPELRPCRVIALPPFDDQELWPYLSSELQSLNDQVARIQCSVRTFLIDPRSGQATRVVPNTRLSALSPDGGTLWLLDKRYRFISLSLSDQTAQTGAPWVFTRSLNSPNADRYSNSFARSIEVRSPLTGAEVATFQCLNLTSDLKLEWVASTANNDYTGSPGWKKLARVAWRGEGPAPPASLGAVKRAFTNPETLTSEVSRPVSYKPLEGKGEEKTVAALLDRIVKEPGDWNQMCSVSEAIPPDRLPLDGYDREWATNFLSEENFQRVRDKRGPALALLARRLPKLIPQLTGKASSQTTVQDPNDRLEIYLMFLLDLNGVEALPQLLEVERALSKSAAYPSENQSSKDSERSVRYSYHVQVLSVIATTLSNEGVPKMKELGDTETTYERAHRELIISAARHYLKTTPPEKFRGAAGMSANVKYR